MQAAAAPSIVDFIVVGAGSAGSAVAARLSESGRHIALLEAGLRDRSPWIHLPIGYGRTMWDRRLNWRFHTEPERELNDRAVYWPRGKVLGGCSSINGLIAIRGQRQDYDGWRDLGNPGWGFSDVLPYFMKLEDHEGGGDEQLHGRYGPIPVTRIPAKHELVDAAIEAATRLGVPRSSDFNGASQEGAGYFQLTTRRGWRVSAARGYLGAERQRPNLSIVTGIHVTGVTFDGQRAAGVNALVGDGKEIHIAARKGVVLCAGAIQSPQLLMLSGIGDASELKSIGIAVRIDRPEVGRNLQDHLRIPLVYRCSKPVTTNDALNSLLGKVCIALQWLLQGRGPLAIGINQGGIFARLAPSAQTPDIQIHIGTLSADSAGGKPHPFSGFTLAVCQLRPESRGRVFLKSPHPMAAPAIRPNYLSAEKDRWYAVEAVKFVRALAETEPLSGYVLSEHSPGLAHDSDEEILEFVRARGASLFHPAGTCRMGADDGAVVDPRLRVRGAPCLWVADCSIMPTLTSGNTHLPAVMIGEKAAGMILEDCN